MENLTVLEVNPQQMATSFDRSLFKSPNCVAVGTSLALAAVDSAFGLSEVSCCTFQSLSGRGDAMYPAELVQGNVYPIWATQEKTETYIANEIGALLSLSPSALSVRAQRVGVHIGHFIDVRVRVKAPEKLIDEEAVYAAFESFMPLRSLAGKLPSLPPKPLHVTRTAGAPRSRSHASEFGGMSVAVGNVKLSDGMWHLCFSVVVNNMVRGAYGSALLMAEYYCYLRDHPVELESLRVQAEADAAAKREQSEAARAAEEAAAKAAEKAKVNASPPPTPPPPLPPLNPQ